MLPINLNEAFISTHMRFVWIINQTKTKIDVQYELWFDGGTYEY